MPTRCETVGVAMTHTRPPVGPRAPAGGASAGPPSLDAATLAAARRGESWAQRSFVVAFQTPVFQLVARVLGRAGRSGWTEDVSQDALVRALRSLPGFSEHGPAKLSTWVLTIATRAAIDHLRRVGPETTELDPDDTVHRVESPEIDLDRRAVGEAIARALETLAPEIRAAFVLRAYHELSYPEIAEALAIDLGTVKSRLWRARAALQIRLKEVGHD